MKKLRMKLADRYMEIQEYFNEAFDFLKYFFTKNRVLLHTDVYR